MVLLAVIVLVSVWRAVDITSIETALPWVITALSLFSAWLYSRKNPGADGWLMKQYVASGQELETARAEIVTLRAEVVALRSEVIGLRAAVTFLAGGAVPNTGQAAAWSTPTATRSRELLSRHYDLSGLKILATDSGINADEIPGDTPTEYAAALIDYAIKSGQYARLMAQAKNGRPYVTEWI